MNEFYVAVIASVLGAVAWDAIKYFYRWLLNGQATAFRAETLAAILMFLLYPIIVISVRIIKLFIEEDSIQGVRRRSERSAPRQPIIAERRKPPLNAGKRPRKKKSVMDYLHEPPETVQVLAGCAFSFALLWSFLFAVTQLSQWEPRGLTPLPGELSDDLFNSRGG